MKANYEKQIARKADLAIGHELDKYVTFGVRMAALVLHNEFGFGQQRLQKFMNGVQNLVNQDIKAGAEQFTENYRINLEHGMYRVNEEYYRLMHPEAQEKIDEIGKELLEDIETHHDPEVQKRRDLIKRAQLAAAASRVSKVTAILDKQKGVETPHEEEANGRGD